MKKKNIFIILAILAVSIIVACNNSKNSDEPEIIEEAPTTVYEANLNPSDPNLLNITAVNGDKLFVLGEKDENGMPVRVSELLLQQDGAEELMRLSFDESQRITEFVDENGVKMILDWVSDSKAALTLIEPETGEQLNTLVDFDDVSQEKASQLLKPVKTNLVPRQGDVSMRVEPIKTPVEPTIKRSAKAQAGGRSGYVKLTACTAQLPFDAKCYVDVYRMVDKSSTHQYVGPSEEYLTTLACERVETGLYKYTLPAEYIQKIQLSEYCEAISEVAKPVCEANSILGVLTPMTKQAICFSITLALAAGTVTAPIAIPFEGICTKLGIFLDMYCLTSDISNQDFTLTLCSAIKAQDVIVSESTLSIRPWISGAGRNIKGTPGLFKASQPLSMLHVVSNNFKSSIDMFTLNPPAPNALQGYVAEGRLYCMLKGAEIIMSIVGTDGYSKSESHTIDGDALIYNVTMSVPGAATAGIRDECTITVTMPSGETLKKTAILFFQ